MEQLKSPSNPFLIHKIVKLKRGTADIQLRCHRVVWKPLSIIGGSCHKYHFCCDKSFVVTNTCLLQQNTSFVVTKYFVSTKLLLWQIFVTTNIILLWQKFCHDEHVFFLQQKTCFVTTNMCLLQQKYACCDKTFVATKLCLLQQNYVCRDKNDTCSSSRQWYLRTPNR